MRTQWHTMRWRTCIIRQVSLFPNQTQIKIANIACPPCRRRLEFFFSSRNFGWVLPPLCLRRFGMGFGKYCGLVKRFRRIGLFRLVSFRSWIVHPVSGTGSGNFDSYAGSFDRLGKVQILGHVGRNTGLFFHTGFFSLGDNFLVFVCGLELRLAFFRKLAFRLASSTFFL